MAWHWYETSTGKGKARAEFEEGLGRYQRAALIDLMERYEADLLLPRQITHVEGNIFALKTSLDGVALRLYFAKLGHHKAVCLVVKVLNKKTEKIPPRVLQQARSRVADWENRHRDELKP